MAATGTATANFGATPGTNQKTVTVNSAAVLTASLVEAFIMADSTADHNAEEHKIIPFRIVCGNIVNAVSFDVTLTTELRITGLISFRWVHT